MTEPIKRRRWFCVARLGTPAVNAAMECKLRAKLKAGAMLAVMVKHSGGRPSKTDSTVESVALSDMRIELKQSNR